MMIENVRWNLNEERWRPRNAALFCLGAAIAAWALVIAVVAICFF
jgi:hypothetical protein